MTAKKVPTQSKAHATGLRRSSEESSDMRTCVGPWTTLLASLELRLGLDCLVLHAEKVKSMRLLVVDNVGLMTCAMARSGRIKPSSARVNGPLLFGSIWVAKPAVVARMSRRVTLKMTVALKRRIEVSVLGVGAKFGRGFELMDRTESDRNLAWESWTTHDGILVFERAEIWDLTLPRKLSPAWDAAAKMFESISG